MSSTASRTVATRGDHADRKSRSGAEQRHRTTIIGVRVTPEEKERLMRAAAARGLTAPELLRVGNDDPTRGPQSQVCPTYDDDGPLQPGHTLRGVCGGAFGRDSYGDKVIEGVGPDWVVAREDNGEVVFAVGNPDLLREYRV